MTTDQQNSTDTLLTCQECGVEFVWTVTQQRSSVPSEGPLVPPPQCPACRRLAAPPGLSRGRVKWYNRTKGWGFITVTSGEELFVHRSGLTAGLISLQEGDLVEFSVGQTPKGPAAQEVRRLSAD
jgi:CspA family cold shock protein